MSLNLIRDIKTAYSNLNPGEVRQMAERPITVGVAVREEGSFAALERFLRPLVPGALVRITGGARPENHDLLFCEQGLECPRGSFSFRLPALPALVDSVLDARPDLEIPLARHFDAFRSAASSRIIARTARENALFSLVTALPNIVPNLLELPWAVGEFATDTAFLTINQVRMAFLLAAVHGKPIGYGEQKVELAGILAGAFGWRALARELIGKVPLGGGLIPKAAIAFAGTFVVGLGLERLHQTGEILRKSDRREAYTRALEQGKGLVQQLVSGIKKRNAA